MKYIIYLLMFSFCCFLSCETEERGQYAVDSIPPGKVSNATVENIEGGAIINYTIPNDDDLLYVKAVYERTSGEIVEQKSSSYSNSIQIEGIGKSREVKVQLIAGDRSQNESEPVEVIAQPLDAAIYSILDSMKMDSDFGGMRISWKNPTEAEIVITVSTLDELGEWTDVESFYTKVPSSQGSVRGFENEERQFGISIRDRWGNVTDTLVTTLTPLFEERIEPENAFRRWNPPGIDYSHYADAYSIEKLFDDNPKTFYLVLAPGLPYSFTFDMGQTVKFSRLKQIQRNVNAGFFYSAQNVEAFEIWGAESAEGLTDDFNSGWIKMGEFNVEKPSGLPLGQNTDEDVAVAIGGHEFNVNPDAPKVRYIRYVIAKNWSSSNINAIAELQFWGSK
ncbi:DUF5000 domain-containing lipoprotein [Membranihabitans marinus]|uniref:DUF5000 domain-containing lipoprotein n=1 Tax=Membranihabitans marinus TaxID=1227546 RepID=UPI001F34AB97|nr:DUF5000 domain-containing lipoprotein [Membranihabitans marinus]